MVIPKAHFLANEYDLKCVKVELVTVQGATAFGWCIDINYWERKKGQKHFQQKYTFFVWVLFYGLLFS